VTLESRLGQDLKRALKAGDKTRLSVLRMAIAAVKNRKIEIRTDPLDDDAVTAILQKTVKQHKESIEKFRLGGREDLVSKETEEMGILEEYLPEQLSPEALSVIVDEAIERVGAMSPGGMGAVIKEVMTLVKGRADGRAVSSMVKEKLI
jgi:uncharacterized protein